MHKIEVSTLKENFIDLIGKQWMLITAGNMHHYNTMTASWGTVGFLWGKPVVCVVIRPQRYTLEFVEKEDCFTLSFFDEKYRDALKLCGTKSGREVNKAEAAGITPFEPSSGCVAFKEARLIMKCRKLYSDQLRESSFLDKSILETWYPSRDFHKVFIGVIEELWEE